MGMFDYVKVPETVACPACSAPMGGWQTKDGDWVEQLYVATAHSYILAFTAKGHVYWLKVHQIPELGPAAKDAPLILVEDG